jgi:hypothetical protein
LEPKSCEYHLSPSLDPGQSERSYSFTGLFTVGKLTLTFYVDISKSNNGQFKKIEDGNAHLRN